MEKSKKVKNGFCKLYRDGKRKATNDRFYTNSLHLGSQTYAARQQVLV